jgi:hypothetical protein
VPPAGNRHRLDLNELVGIAEDGHAQQRAWCVVVAEGIADDLPGSQQVGAGARGDVHGRLGHVGQPGTRRAKRHREVGHHLVSLGGDIAWRHDGAVGVKRAGAGSEHQPSGRRHRGVCVRDGVGEGGATDQLDGRHLPIKPPGPRPRQRRT